MKKKTNIQKNNINQSIVFMYLEYFWSIKYFDFDCLFVMHVRFYWFVYASKMSTHSQMNNI